ncbi:MAG: hypothetical protein EHM19_05130 [Candidatus Latescibacterota bacterium]|nr:MAG: hypothetical protein EHM19_05130 [Candidatus Latescibacterota bacterium]
MRGYDLDFLRSITVLPPRRIVQSATVWMLAAGLLLAAGEWRLRRDAESRREADRIRLEEREREARKADPQAEALREAVRARAERVPWRPALVALANALPPGHRLLRAEYDQGSGSLRIEAEGDARVGARDFAEKLSAEAAFAANFSVTAVEAGRGTDYVVVCVRRDRS